MKEGDIMKKYEVIIGLEVHAQLLTETKIFCRCSTKFGSEPNTQTCQVCTGMPGVLPVVNRRAIEALVRAGAFDALHPTRAAVLLSVGLAMEPIGTAHDPLEKQVVDNRYRLVRRIGSGGMAVVYLAERVGIGKPEARERTVGHVLGGFARDEAPVWMEVADKAVAAVEALFEHGLAKAMTEFNRRG